MVALRDPATIMGDNLSTVLYVRDGEPALSWQSKSWDGDQDQAGIIKEIMAQYQIPDCENWLWDVRSDFEIASAVAKGDPETIEKGLLTSDPLSAQIPLGEIREIAVKFLSDIGYKAADVPIEKTGDESADCRNYALNRIAYGFETYLTFQGTDEQRELAGFAAATPPVTLPGDGPSTCDIPGSTSPCLQTWTWPAASYGEVTCSGWTTSTSTTGGWIVTTTQTCYARNCAQLQRATVMTQDNCVSPPLVTVSYVYRAVTYIERCCVNGIGGTAPPVPCTPTKKDILPGDWTPSIPPVPGDTPGNPTITWPVNESRCQSPR